MTLARAAKRSAPLLVVALAVAFAMVPNAFGFSTGMTSENSPNPAFDEIGCTACHGPGASGHADFAVGNVVSWTILDADGNPPAGNVYAHGTDYTVHVMLDETNVPEAGNRAGFNLRVTIGTFTGVDGESQVDGTGIQAAHVSAARADWKVIWTSPEADEGPAIFDLFVNDVDGSGDPNAGDMVYRDGWYILDATHTPPGAATEEHETHYGVSLPQYWLGLIALASMIFVMLFTFVYMKWVSPHNSDQKDR